MPQGHKLANLIAFLERDVWRDAFEATLDRHFGHALETLDLAFEEVEAALGPDWTATLWGCAFEDFLTQALEPDGRNLIEDYLKRRGYKETARTKSYMRGLRDSVMSLYEVSEIQPGASLLARDLIRGGEPRHVRETTASRTLKPWDRIAARIVPDGKDHVFGGGLLPFSEPACEMLLGGLREAIAMRGETGDGTGETGLEAIGDETLRRLAPLFTTSWLLDAAPKALGEDQPDIRNADGEPVVFHTFRFPFRKGVRRDTIARRLDGDARLCRESETFWNWLGAPPSEPGLARAQPGSLCYEVTMDDGRPVLGNVEIKGRSLVLSVSSAGRAERGTALLKALFGDSLTAPDVEIRTIEEMRAERTGEPAGHTEFPVEVATPIIHEQLDRHYRSTLDAPLATLGDRSPREAVRTEAGRARVAEWLKMLENGAAAHPEGDPLRTYDLGWLWHELGIEALRR